MKTAQLILHYGAEKYTRALMQMLPDALVVDNGSPEPFAGAAWRQPDLGFTAGWNAAVQRVFQDYEAFLLMNSDIRITPKVVEELARCLRTQPGFGVISGACNSPHPVMKPRLGSRGLREVPFVEFTAPLITRETFEEIGFFDERFRSGYGVEYDFCYRAWEAGIGAGVCDRARFRHYQHKSIKATVGFKPFFGPAKKEMLQGLSEKYGERFFDPEAFPFWKKGGFREPCSGFTQFQVLS